MADHRFRVRLLLLLALMAGGWPRALLAQTTVMSLGREELPYPENTAFVSRDADGFYWFGNDNGLTRFDGAAARHFQIRDPDAVFTHDQNVQSRMYTDGEGRSWFTTYAALHAFDPRTETFFTDQLVRADGPLTEDYRAFHYHAPRDELWLRAGDSLYAYSIPRRRFRPLGGPTRAVNYTVVANGDDAWRIVGSPWWNGPGIEVFDSEPDGERVTLQPWTGVPQMVVDAAALSADSWYLATVSGLVHLRIGPAGTTATPIAAEDGRAYSTAGICYDARRDRLFVSRPRAGVFTYDRLSGAWRPFATGSAAEPEPIPREIYLATDDVLWISHHRRGLDYVRLSAPQHFRAPGPPDVAELSDLIAVAGDSLLLLTPRGRLYAGQLGQNGSVAWTELRNWTNGRAPPFRGRFYQDATGLFVIGQRRLYYRPANATEWRYYALEPSQLRAMLTSPAGQRRLLISKGVVQDVLLGDTLLVQRPIPELTVAENKGFIQLLPLSATEFLLPRQGNTVLHCRWENERLCILDRLPTPGDVYCASPYHADTVLLGTSQGLYRWAGQEFRPVNRQPLWRVLPPVRTLVPQTVGYVWVGTENGLFRYGGEREELTYYSEADGLLGSRFLQIAGHTDPYGSVYLATDRGLLAVDRKSDTAPAARVVPYVRDLWVNKTPLDADRPADQLDALALSYRENTLDIQLGLIGLERSAAAGLIFALAGYEERAQWVEPGGFARYPNLPPGDYTLHLTAVDRNGRTGAKKELLVRIAPPFYATWWFRGLAVLAAVAMLSGTYFLLLRRAVRKQTRLREQQARIAAERDRIAGEVHDDLGGQLSSILFLSEELLLRESATDPSHPELSRIHELSRSSLQNIRDIIFALDTRRGTLADLVRQLEENGRTFFADRTIKFTSRSTLAEPAYELSSRQKRNLSLIGKEAYHNIFKHAAAGWVRLWAESTPDELTLRISDDGRGFRPNDEPEDTGYGLENMHRKAAAIGATLTLDTQPGEGTTVTVRLPLMAGDENIES